MEESEASGRWVEIQRYAQWSRAEDDAVALAAVGIASRLTEREAGIALLVARPDALRASYELVEYHRENRPSEVPTVRSPREGINPALAYAALLMFVYGAAGRQLIGLDWWTAGYAQAGLIVRGEWWRTLTALSLHADVAHLASNIIAGIVFGIVLAQFLGSGLAWFAILLAAGIGNALNAFVHPAAHTAVGASTAVFAAVGLVSVFSWRRRSAVPARGMRGWLPLAAGVALLADLGMGGEQTDLGAHAFGFVVGVALGAAILVAASGIPQVGRAQLAFGALTLALFGLAWCLALQSA